MTDEFDCETTLAAGIFLVSIVSIVLFWLFRAKEGAK